MNDPSAILATAEKEAKERAKQIKSKLGSIAEHIEAIPPLVAKAYEAQDWRLLRYNDWEAYVHGEYETHLLRINRAVRKDWTQQFKQIGMSTREIKAVTNVGVATVHRDATVPNGTPHPAGKAPASGEPQSEAKVIRAWAKAQGRHVPSRGRLPAEVVTAFHEAHGADEAPDDDEIAEAEIVPDDNAELTEGQRAVIRTMQQAIDNATLAQCKALANELMALAEHAEKRAA